MEEHSDGGAGPSSFCSRAEGQSFAETDAVFTGADTAAPPIVDHRFIESPARTSHRGTFQKLHLLLVCRGNQNFSVPSFVA